MPNHTVTLAHYYTSPEIQQLADKVGDSLELALYAKETKATTIVVAGVRFMAETVKALNPQAKVILPNAQSTCSLVEQTDLKALKKWRDSYPNHIHVAYINSSIEHKAMADWIVTSRNVNEILDHLQAQGLSIIFSPDRNLGAYLNESFDYKMPLWSAVCEVHDRFNESALREAFNAIKAEKFLISHPESPMPVLRLADFVGSTESLLSWIKSYQGPQDAVIFVATEEGVLYNMHMARPELDLRQAPIYAGCQCNACPYMKMNTIEAVKRAQKEGYGLAIDYISPEMLTQARLPIERMLEFRG